MLEVFLRVAVGIFMISSGAWGCGRIFFEHIERIAATDVSQPLSCSDDASCMANDVDGGMSDADDRNSQPTPAGLFLSPGRESTCAWFAGGRVACWGRNQFGQLGYGNMTNIGDDELPSAVGFVSLGGEVTQLGGNDEHVCALLAGNRLRCWGRNNFGQLGYGNTVDIGDDELPSAVGLVGVTENIVQVAAGDGHTCLLLNGGQVRCWGNNNFGQLGYGNTAVIGDDELPSAVDYVSLGGSVQSLALASNFSCALLVDGQVRCWGQNLSGRLGYGNLAHVGDNELPSSIPPVSLGDTAIALAVGSFHACAVLVNRQIQCWGRNLYGQLGYGNTVDIGDDELPSSVSTVSVGGEVQSLYAGGNQTCVLLTDSQMKCWGHNNVGQLGYGNTVDIGDDELPSSVGAVPVGGAVKSMGLGDFHTCVVLSDDRIKCWGRNVYGELGYGNTQNIGDNELPSSVGTVSIPTM